MWNFGDGSQPKIVNRDANGYLDTSISHTYDRIGNYNVNLTAISESGLVDLSEPQKVNLNRPVGKPFLHWQAFQLQGFYFCHSPSMPVIDTFEGVIHENPGCSSKYWYLGGGDEGIRTSGNEIYSCGTIDDPKYGALDYGIEYVKDTWGHYRTRTRISNQEGTILRNRDIRELKCGTNQYSDRHRIYTIKDVMNFWNHKGELEQHWYPNPKSN